MASRPRQTPEELRKRIVDEATRLFADRGYGATSVQQVADAVGISKQLVLYHFSSKDQLLDVVLEGMAESYRQMLPTLLEGVLRQGPRMEGLLEVSISFFEANPNAARFLLRDMITGGTALERIRGLVEPVVNLAADRLRQGQQSGDLDPDADPEAAVQVTGILLLAYFAIFKPGTTREGMAPPEALEAELQRVLRAALLGPRRTDGD